MHQRHMQVKTYLAKSAMCMIQCIGGFVAKGNQFRVFH